MKTRVAVIGGGAAGLCAVRHLAKHPSTFTITLFEQASTVGGTWVYTDQIGTDSHGLPVHSAMYKNLKTTIPKEMMAFPDFDFDQSLPSNPRHEEVLQYLKNYASSFDLLQYIQFNTQVVLVEPVCDGEEDSGGRRQPGPAWRVTTASLPEKTCTATHIFDAVIVCNGHHSQPRIPSLAGLDTFPGEVLHSHHYRQPQPFRGKTVLCLGAADSGQDIASDLSVAAKQVYLCHDKPCLQSDSLPDQVQQKVGIDRIQGSSVFLKNGEVLRPDCLLFCTGYLYTFPFLSPRCRVHVTDQRVTPLYKHVIHTQFPSLSFLGLLMNSCPFPQFHVQAQLVVSVLKGTTPLPCQAHMEADTEREYQRKRQEGVPPRYFHRLGPRQWAYSDEIARMAGCDPIPQKTREAFHTVYTARVRNFWGFEQLPE